jgi:hypothetical protein
MAERLMTERESLLSSTMINLLATDFFFKF